MLFPIDRILAKPYVYGTIFSLANRMQCVGQAGQRSDNHAVLYDGQPHPF